MPTVNVTKNRNRNRRFTACNRHPSESVTGFCALCLRDRLAGLDDTLIDSDLDKNVVCNRRSKNHVVGAPAKYVAGDCEGGFKNAVVCNRRTKGYSVGAPAPELRRSRSVAGECEEEFKNVVTDRRRSSCDVRPRTSLSDLFEVECGKRNFSSIAENIENICNDDHDEIKDDIRVINDDEEEETDLMTMKEIIEIELQNKPKNYNIWETTSEKMRKWREKQNEKKKKKQVIMNNNNNNNTQSEIAEYGYGRRSCDTEPRFSIDLFEEHRASWDGYMMANKTISSGLDNVIVGNGINKMENLQMQSISEDGVSSGGSSGQSNSDYRGSSSSSSTKTLGLGLGMDHDMKLGSNAKVSPANDVIFQGTKLVITEKELKDWHLSSVKNEKVESVGNVSVLGSGTSVGNPLNVRKKVMSSSWRKVCNLWGHKHKLDDKKNVEHMNTPVNVFERGNSSKLVRNPGRDLVLDRNRSKRYSTSDIDSGLLRLYLTPFRNSRRSKLAKNRAPLMGTNGLQLI